MNNVYLFYYEHTQDSTHENARYTNSNTIQCDTITELLYQLRQAELHHWTNIVITTIQNAKQQA